jgi:hypothetical protein
MQRIRTLGKKFFSLLKDLAEEKPCSGNPGPGQKCASGCDMSPSVSAARDSIELATLVGARLDEVTPYQV